MNEVDGAFGHGQHGSERAPASHVGQRN